MGQVVEVTVAIQNGNSVDSNAPNGPVVITTERSVGVQQGSMSEIDNQVVTIAPANAPVAQLVKTRPRSVR